MCKTVWMMKWTYKSIFFNRRHTMQHRPYWREMTTHFRKHNYYMLNPHAVRGFFTKFRAPLASGEKYCGKIRLELYRVSLKKGNQSFRVQYSIIKNYFVKNIHIIGKLIVSSFIWHNNHDGGSRMTEQGQFVLGMAHWYLFNANKQLCSR